MTIVVHGIIFDSLGLSLGSLSLSAYPPYGAASPGQQLAVISGQSGGQIFLANQDQGVFALSPDGTKLYAGPYYRPNFQRVRLMEVLRGYLNSPMLSDFNAQGLMGQYVVSNGTTPANALTDSLFNNAYVTDSLFGGAYVTGP